MSLEFNPNRDCVIGAIANSVSTFVILNSSDAIEMLNAYHGDITAYAEAWQVSIIDEISDNYDIADYYWIVNALRDDAYAIQVISSIDARIAIESAINDAFRVIVARIIASNPNIDNI